VEDLPQLTQKDFEHHLFQKQPFSFSILAKGEQIASTKNLDEYKEKEKAEHFQRKWNEFEQSFGSQTKTKTFSSRDGQWEIQEKLVDSDTKCYAYLGIVARKNEETYTEKWFLSYSEAESAVTTTQEIYQNYLVKQEKNAHFEQTYQQVKDAYQEIDEQLGEIEGWEDTGYHREILDTMNNIKRTLDRYEDRKMEDIEAIQKSLQLVKDSLTKAQQFLKTYKTLIEQLDEIDWHNIAPEIKKENEEDITLLREYSIEQNEYHILKINGVQYDIKFFHVIEELPDIEKRLQHIKILIKEREQQIMTNQHDLAALFATKF
jgi:hypothetical protein